MKAFVIFRDRVTYARKCVAAMDAAGLEPVIVDRGSTWPGAIEWLIGLKGTLATVVDDGGGHPRDLWARGWFWSMTGTSERYVVTDPDCVPSEDCPQDWLQRLGDVLDRGSHAFHKAGLGLRLDRIPDHYPRRDQVTSWEGQFWKNPVEGETEVYDANIDTTLALYRSLTDQGAHSFSALRTGYPYVADHLAWYEDYASLTDEQQWYYDHLEPGISEWTIPGRSVNRD